MLWTYNRIHLQCGVLDIYTWHSGCGAGWGLLHCSQIYLQSKVEMFVCILCMQCRCSVVPVQQEEKGDTRPPLPAVTWPVIYLVGDENTSGAMLVPGGGRGSGAGAWSRVTIPWRQELTPVMDNGHDTAPTRYLWLADGHQWPTSGHSRLWTSWTRSNTQTL